MHDGSLDVGFLVLLVGASPQAVQIAPTQLQATKKSPTNRLKGGCSHILIKLSKHLPLQEISEEYIIFYLEF